MDNLAMDTPESPVIRVAEIPGSTDPKTSPLLMLGDLVGKFLDDAEARNKALVEGRPFGPVPAFQSVAQEYGGAFPDGTHIVLGGSGVGKTAFALQCAAQCGCPSLYVSCEMSALELLRRLAARVTKTRLGRFRSGEIQRTEMERLVTRTVQESPRMAILDATENWPDISQIARAARHVRGASPHVLIVMDSLHSWADGLDSAANEYEAVSDACTLARGLAASVGCPVLAIAERNRASFSKSAGKDKISSGAGSRKLEYGSESVLSLERLDEMPPGDPRVEKVIELTFAKNRNGSAGATVKMVFDGSLQTYREMRA